MGDLEVDANTLELLHKDLGTVKEAFDGIEGWHDDNKGLWSDGDMRDALDEFSGNMDHHRKELSAKIKTMQDKVKNVLETWENADADLKKQLEESAS